MRLKFKDITFARLVAAIWRRILNLREWYSWKFSALAKQHQQKIRQFKSIHQGKRCFIIANGPSLKKTDLSFLKDEFTIGMNRIYLLFNELGFKPTYYVCSNNLLLEQFTDDIDALKMPKFLNWSRKELFTNENSHFVKHFLSLNDGFSTDISKGTYGGGTVTYFALQLAYYMGFTEVYLVGLDHNFAEKGTPNKTEVRTENEDKSHFHPNYFPKGIKWQLPDLLRSELAYELAAKHFGQDNRKVEDLTVGGKCEVFPKREYSKFWS